MSEYKVEVHNLTKNFGSLKVLNDISFSYKNSIDFSVSFYNYHEPSIYPCL